MYRCKVGNIKWLKSWWSPPPGKVGSLSYCSRRVALIELAHLGAFLATYHLMLLSRHDQTSFVESRRELAVLHARSSVFVFVHDSSNQIAKESCDLVQEVISCFAVPAPRQPDSDYSVILSSFRARSTSDTPHKVRKSVK